MYNLVYFLGVSTRRNRWDETPKTDRGTPGHTTPGQSTPGWAETPRTDRTGAQTPGATPTPGSKRRSRWDETPSAQMGGGTPMFGTSGVTPAGAQAMQMSTPTPGMCVCVVTSARRVYAVCRLLLSKINALTYNSVLSCKQE